MMDILKDEMKLLVSLGYSDYTLLENNYDLSINLGKKKFTRCNIDRIRDYKNKKDENLFWSEKFSYKYFLNRIQLPFLNGTAGIFPLKDVKALRVNTLCFCKPVDDLKHFDATLVPVGQYLDNYLTYNYPDEGIDHLECVLTSHLHTITNESRFYIVDGKVITGSYYRVNDKLHNKLITPDEEVFKIAQQYVDIFNPCQAYVMDLALVGNTQAVVEFNSINCSGLYACDYPKLLKALDNRGPAWN